MTKVFRIQGRSDGRGPYRPGLTGRWQDPNGPAWPDIFTEFGYDWWHEIPHGWSAGCGFLGLEGLRRWFAPTELSRLAAMGFCVVEIKANLIVRRSPRQIIFAKRGPLTQINREIRFAELAPA